MKSGIGLTGKAITMATKRDTTASSDTTKAQEIRDLRRMVDLLYCRYETTRDRWYLRTAERTRRKLRKEILDFDY